MLERLSVTVPEIDGDTDSVPDTLFDADDETDADDESDGVRVAVTHAVVDTVDD